MTKREQTVEFSSTKFLFAQDLVTVLPPLSGASRLVNLNARVHLRRDLRETLD